MNSCPSSSGVGVDNELGAEVCGSGYFPGTGGGRGILGTDWGLGGRGGFGGSAGGICEE